MTAATTPHRTRRSMRLSDLWDLLKVTVSAWIDDYAPSMGAALAYYTLFSLAPVLLIVIAVAGMVFGSDAVHGQLFGELRDLFGDAAAASIESLLASVSKPAEGITATLVGIVVVLIAATTVFGELQNALDRIWRAPAAARANGVLSALRARLLSFSVIVGLSFLLMVSLVFGAVVSALGAWWSHWFGGWTLVAQGVNVLLGFALSTLVFAMIYKMIPRVRVQWPDVWLGAVVTSLLFSVGKLLIGIYIGRSDIASGYGAAGSLVVVLLWVYYSAQIFLLGAEFTWAYALRFGSMQSLAQPAVAPTSPAAAETSCAPIPSRSDPGGQTKPAAAAAALQPALPRVRRRAAPRRWLAPGLALAASLWAWKAWRRGPPP